MHTKRYCKVFSIFSTCKYLSKFTSMTRKTRKRLTRRRISPMQKKAQVMVTDKTEAKMGDTGPQSSLTITSKL